MSAYTRTLVGTPMLRIDGRVALHAGMQLQGRYTRCRQCRRRVLLPPVRAEPGRALEEAWAEAVDEAEDGEAGSTELPSAGHGYGVGFAGLEEHARAEAGTDAGISEAGLATVPAATSEAPPEPGSRAEVSDLISKVVNLVRTAHILAPYDKNFNVALLLWCVPDGWCHCLVPLRTAYQELRKIVQEDNCKHPCGRPTSPAECAAPHVRLNPLPLGLSRQALNIIWSPG